MSSSSESALDDSAKVNDDSIEDFTQSSNDNNNDNNTNEKESDDMQIEEEIIQEDKDDREKPKDKLDLCSNNLEKSSTQKENRTLDFDVNNSVQNDADQQMDITSNECNQNTQINNKDNEDENKDDREKPKDKLDLYPNNLEKSSTQKDSRTLDFDANNSVENDADQQMDITSNECNQNTTQINNEGESKKPKAEEKIQDINPHRSLGDAMEQWRKRLNIIDIDNSVTENHESEHEEQQKETESYINHQKMFEYLKDDETSHDTQTMGPAAEDQTREMDITGAIDDDDEDMYQNSEDAVEDGMRGAILNKRKKDSGTHQSNDDHEEEEAVSQNMDMSNIVHAPIPQEQFASMRDHLEMKLSEWRENGRDVVQARDLWQKYDSLTHDLANGLCEQLRLILEPTMATRLKGDYKTGKRLNMKKIIPYIASDFKKDKIWLRRTKPSKRQYQVMIAVDDSKSMCETHSIQLAYETLALISKALSQLEVGAISIVNFGKDVRILHPFDQPFTADAGAKVLQQFTFEQDKTLVRSLMDTTIGLLKHARVNNIGTNGGASRNTELWQLQIIISDGVCEDHASLKTLVRQAAEAQIMVIFIIVDNKPNEKDSIMSMNHVKYSQVDGRMMLRMQKYLDTFPFDYYVVLRDINALPETLADALRQYFSVVGNL